MLVYTTGRGRARLHARPVHRRVPALAPEHPHPEQAQVLQRQPGQLSPTGRTGVQAYTDWLQRDTPEKKGLSLRYIGSLVADFHRNLLNGRRLLLPGRHQGSQEAGRQAAAALRGGAAGLPGRAGRRLRLRRHAGDPRHPARRSCTSACRSSSAAGIWWRRPRRWCASTTGWRCRAGIKKSQRGKFLSVTSSKYRWRCGLQAGSSDPCRPSLCPASARRRSMMRRASSGSKLRSSRSRAISPGYW